MGTTLHRRLVIWGLGTVLAAAGTASAQLPIVGTEVTRFTEGPFSDDGWLDAKPSSTPQPILARRWSTSPTSRRPGRCTTT